MRLVLDEPGLGDGVTVELGPIVLLPDDVDGWIDATVAGEQVIADEERETVTGWPMRVVTSETRAAGERVTTCTRAFYAFFEHAAVACVRSLAAHDAGAAAEALARVRPDFGGAVACLDDLVDTSALSRSSSTPR